MLDCPCKKCTTGEEDIFEFEECLNTKSELELQKIKLEQSSSPITVFLATIAFGYFIALGLYSLAKAS